MGNSRARAVYEANLPDNFRRPQNDSSLESFIRAKYEHKKYIAREWVPPELPKVNWEKEIDEEMERQKNKKKTAAKVVNKNALSNIEVPQLPKPKNPSPKSTRVSQSSTSSNESKQNTDLLGLQNGEDNFGGFLSAPVAEEKKKEDADPVKSEEKSFFNQTAPPEKEKVKLTKDSILALYSTPPPVNNFNQFQNQTQIPYQQGFPAQGFQNFNNYPVQTLPQQNGQFTAPMQYPNPNHFQGQFVNNMQWGGLPQNTNMQVPTQPFSYQNGPNQVNLQANQGMINPLGQVGQFPQNSNFVTPNTVPNPFYGTQTANLQQQFNNMSLNNPQSASPAPSLATNIWQ